MCIHHRVRIKNLRDVHKPRSQNKKPPCCAHTAKSDLKLCRSLVALKGTIRKNPFIQVNLGKQGGFTKRNTLFLTFIIKYLCEIRYIIFQPAYHASIWRRILKNFIVEHFMIGTTQRTKNLLALKLRGLEISWL